MVRPGIWLKLAINGERFALLTSIYYHYFLIGNSHVSRTVPDGELKPLARWIKTQRALYKSGKILADRKAKLEAIEFVWDGTQLPVKRKRKRQSDDVKAEEKTEDSKAEAEESKVEEPPTKRVKVEDPKVVDDKASADAKADEAKKEEAKKDTPVAATADAAKKTDASATTKKEDEATKMDVDKEEESKAETKTGDDKAAKADKEKEDSAKGKAEDDKAKAAPKEKESKDKESEEKEDSKTSEEVPSPSRRGRSSRLAAKAPPAAGLAGKTAKKEEEASPGRKRTRATYDV